MFYYTVEGVSIERVDVIRDLGVLTYEALKFNSYVPSICTAAIMIFRRICRISKNFQNSNSLIYLFKSRVSSKLEVASVAWSSISNTLSEKPDALGKKLVRVIYARYSKRTWYYELLI